MGLTVAGPGLTARQSDSRAPATVPIGPQNHHEQVMGLTAYELQ